MRTTEFRDWLQHVHIGKQGSALGDTTIAARIANCETVDRCEGDLDQHVAKDGMFDLQSRLTYSADDQKRGIPLRHRVPINGDPRTGSATLKSAVKLYRQFCVAWPPGAPRPAFPEVPRTPVTGKRSPRPQSLAWPTWPLPNDAEVLALARVVMPYVRFLSPDIVAAIVEDNERHRQEWSDAFRERGINPDAYLWKRSPCAFPGVRRYAGSREVAMYRGHLKDEDAKIEQALRLMTTTALNTFGHSRFGEKSFRSTDQLATRSRIWPITRATETGSNTISRSLAEHIAPNCSACTAARQTLLSFRLR